MVSVAEKNRMRDYLVDRLKAGGAKVEPVTRELAPGAGKANYLKVNDKGVVFLVDREYPAERFGNTLGFMTRVRANVAVVFYKDGETFFKSCAKDTHLRAKGRSLKHYTPNEVNQMILLRPEEILINQGRPNFEPPFVNGWVQYFQPASERLTEGVRSFRFEPVSLDYSYLEHLRGTGQYVPDNCLSNKWFIWREEQFRDGPLQLNRRSVGPVVPVQQTA